MAKRNKYAKAHRYGPKRVAGMPFRETPPKVEEPVIVAVKEVIALAKRKSKAFAKKVSNVVAFSKPKVFEKDTSPKRVGVNEINDQPVAKHKVAEPELAWPLRNVYSRQLVA